MPPENNIDFHTPQNTFNSQQPQKITYGQISTPKDDKSIPVQIITSAHLWAYRTDPQDQQERDVYEEKVYQGIAIYFQGSVLMFFHCLWYFSVNCWKHGLS